MTNLEETKLPFKCISYYASSKSQIDGKNSYCYWFRGKLIRIIADKPFARGDILNIISIETNSNNGIIINTTVDTGDYEKYPVLSFVSTRLVYNKYSDFEFVTSPEIKIIKTIDQIMDDNYSVCFIILTDATGTIHAIDKRTNNYFDINISLDWKE